MKYLHHISRGKLLAGGAIFALLLLIAIGWRQFAQRPGQLPTAEELREPFVISGSGGGQGPSGGMLLTDQLEQAMRDGKTVKIKGPGGGSILIAPAKGSAETPNGGK
jgi:hypothetical protein